jgi:hypothetical protein
MHIVAIHNLPEKKDMLAHSLASALKTTVYESLSRLRSAGTGPLVVAVFSATGQAEELVSSLRANNFDAILLSEDEVKTAVPHHVVRKFRLEDHALHAKFRSEEELVIHYDSINLFIRGTAIAQDTVTETITEKKFDPGMALLTSGLKITKMTKKSLESTAQTREGFFYLYAGDNEKLVFRENGLLYDSLGKALQPTRQANFSYLIGELRLRSPHALYDDRLLTRAGQVQMLGPSLEPEKYLDIATSLLARVLR